MAPRRCTHRNIDYEPNFIGASFRGKPFCDAALEMLTNSDLIVLTKLPQFAYPRVIKAFYSTLDPTCDEDTGEAKFFVKIDGKEIVFNNAMVAKALGIRKYTPLEYEEHDIQIELDLCARPQGVRKDKEVRESFMHEHMWLVVKFMKQYVFPWTHGQIVPKYTLKYVHGMQKGRGVDLPALMLDMMVRSRDMGRANLPHNLVCGRSITAILKAMKYVFQPNEERVGEIAFGVFDYNWIERSMKSLADMNDLGDPNEKKKSKKGKEKAGSSRSARLSEMDDEMGEDEEAQEGGANFNQQHFWPPQNQWESFMKGQEKVLTNQNQMYEMFQGMDIRMQGYGTTLEGMQGSIQGLQGSVKEMQGTLSSLDSRVHGLEDQRWGTGYQRRKNTMSFEEESGGKQREN